MDKQLLRKRLAKEYQKHPLARYVQSSLVQIEALSAFQEAEEVLAYIPMQDEIPFIQLLQNKYPKKQWFVPSSNEQFVHIENTFEYWKPDEHKTIILVPARAVTAGGERLGRGGGWYDTFLSQHPTATTLTMVPDFALLESIPTESHDVTIQHVLIATALES